MTTKNSIKDLLNKLSVWLYLKTRKIIKTPEQLLYGMKVVENKYLPKDTIYMGTGDKDLLRMSFLNQEINICKRSD